ncbi:hypothetical protein F4810DRAFT_143085 [Camillea tinctor]|nr:hypothetical protein F4810DRAFT_143085 [Camillea tinctor]
MAALPKGWEWDYDGSRWFYRYKPTGITQFQFPKPGDEFPEFVGLGVGPLDLVPEERLAREQQVKRHTSDGSTKSGTASRINSKGKADTTSSTEEYGMSATGYFDPESFMYTGSSSNNDVSPVAGEDGGSIGAAVNPTGKKSVGQLRSQQNEAFELHEDTRQVWTPVGFVSELASSDTAKCAEELAPIELDATSSTPVPIRTDVAQDVPAELPTHKSPADPKPAAVPSPKPMQPVDSYPLVSASFAYPPLKTAEVSSTATKPVNTHSEELKVLASERPASENMGQTQFQPWTPAQRIVGQNSQLPNRNSMNLSQESVLQTQNNDLGDFGKRHSLSGAIGNHTANSDIPDALKIQTKQNVLETSQNTLNSPAPAVLQPSAPPYQVLASQASPEKHPIVIPGNGARHESISSGSGKPDPSYIKIQPGLTHIPSTLEPGAQQEQVLCLGSQKPHIGAQETHIPTQVVPHTQAPNDHLHNNRVNTMPNKLPSQTPTNGPPRMNGPGFLFFHEIPTGNETMGTEHDQQPEENPNAQIPTSKMNANHQHPEESHVILTEPLPVIAPLALSKPQKSSASPVSQPPVSSSNTTLDQISEGISGFHVSLPQSAEDKPSNPIGVAYQSSTQSSSQSNSTEVVSGTGKLSTGIPGADPQPGSGQYQLGHTEQATTNYSMPEGVVSVSNQSHNPSHRPSISQSLQKPPTPVQTPSQATSLPRPPQGPGPVHYPVSSTHPSPQTAFYPVQNSTAQPIDIPGHPQAGNNQQKPSQATQIHQPGSKLSGPNGQPNGSLQSQIQGMSYETQAATISNPQTYPIPPITSPITNYQNTQITVQAGNIGNQTVSTVGQPPSRPSSVPMPPHPQHGVQRPQSTVNHVNNGLNNPSKPPQGHQGVPNGPAPITANMGHPGFSTSPHWPQQTSIQGQPLKPPVAIMSPSQLASGSKPTQSMVSQGQNQSSSSFSSPSHAQLQHASPSVHHSSPSQSQVSSPTLSIASLNRPPSSASSHTQFSAAITAIPSTFSPMPTNTQSPNLAKPPVATQQPSHINQNRPPNSQHNTIQGGAQIPFKPFPMLPGQVTPLPSQVGAPTNPFPIHSQTFNSQPKPPHHVHQPSINQQMQQAPPPRPFQQTNPVPPNQAQYIPGLGKPTPGQAHPSQIPPQTQTRPPQQQTHPNTPIGQLPQGMYQGVNQPYPMKIQQPTAPVYNTQQTIQSNVTVTAPTSNQLSTFAPPPTIQGQQLAQAQGGQTSVQFNSQGKPSGSDQAAAVLTSAGKGMKKWAKKMWQNPAIKQTTAAVGGAIIAESIGGDGVAGAALANRIYTSTQTPQPRPQVVTGPQRPPGLVHAQTAPPQAQGIPGSVPQQYQTAQVVNRPQLGMQPVGVQTPGRPVMVQNQAMMGATVNINAPQQVGAIQQQQQQQQQQQRPPQAIQGQYVGRPQLLPPPPPQMMTQQNYAPGPLRPIAYPQASQPNQAQDAVDPNLVAIASIGGAAIGAALRANQQHEPAASTSSSYPASHSEQQQHHGYQEPQHHEYQEQQQQQHHEQSQHYEPQGESHATATHENPDSYFSPPEQYAPDTTSNTAIASTTDNSTYADSSATNVYVDNSTTYIDNSAYAETNTATSYADATPYADATAYTDASAAAVDASYADGSAPSYAAAYTSTEASYALDASASSAYAVDGAYAGGYPDAAYMDVGADVNVSMSMEVDAAMMAGEYGVEGGLGDASMVGVQMEESVSVEVDYSADYSGGGWGEEAW